MGDTITLLSELENYKLTFHCIYSFRTNDDLHFKEIKLEPFYRMSRSKRKI